MNNSTIKLHGIEQTSHMDHFYDAFFWVWKLEFCTTMTISVFFFRWTIFKTKSKLYLPPSHLPQLCSLTLHRSSSLFLGPAGCFCRFLWLVEGCGHTCTSCLSRGPAPRRKKRWRCRFSPHGRSPRMGLCLRVSASVFWTGQVRCLGFLRGAGGSQNCTRCGSQHLYVTHPHKHKRWFIFP